MRAAAAEQSVCQAKEFCCKKALLSQSCSARLTCTHESAGSAKAQSGEEMRRVLLLVATALAFTQNRRRPRGRRRDVLRHAGADDEFVRNAWATPKRTCPRSSRARGTSPRATTSRAARWQPRRRPAPLLALLAYYTQYLVLDGSPLIVDFGFDDVPQVVRRASSGRCSGCCSCRSWRWPSSAHALPEIIVPAPSSAK